MARKPRIHFSGAVYHVILNGLDGQAVFKSVADRRHWESLLADGVGRFGHLIHGYCWSRNHVQIAVQVKEAPLSKVMQNLTFRYTRYFNATHSTSGPVFHGRYKAILIDAGQYLNELVRYIHNNPVRNGQAKSAANTKWTSYAGYIDAKSKPDWLTTETVLGSFGKNEKIAVKNFVQFVDAARNEGERVDLMKGREGGRILGSEKFIKKALKPVKTLPKVMTLNQLVKRVCREEGVKEAELCTPSRARSASQIRQTITYLAMELEIASLTDMARRFNRDLTTMSRNQRYYRDQLAVNKTLQSHVRKVRCQVQSN